MLDRQQRSFIFKCDGCCETLTSKGNFYAALAEAKQEGWTKKKTSLGWQHFCPKCK